MVVILFMLFCGFGALLRFYSSIWNRASYPWGTLFANCLGCFALGLLYRYLPNSPLYSILGTGFCGGLTTFSTFQAEVMTLLKSPRRLLTYLVLTYLLGFAALALGYLL